MKVIAETTGEFMLLDAATGSVLWEWRPSVIVWSAFFEARAGAGQVKILVPDLPDEADDEVFEGWLKDSESVEQAIGAYVSTFDATEDDERLALEEEAKTLGVSFNSRTKTEILTQRILEAKTKAD